MEWNLKGVYKTISTSHLPEMKMLLLNGIQQAMGRYPNSGYLTYQSHVENIYLKSDQLAGMPDWKGAGNRYKENPVGHWQEQNHFPQRPHNKLCNRQLKIFLPTVTVIFIQNDRGRSISWVNGILTFSKRSVCFFREQKTKRIQSECERPKFPCHHQQPGICKIWKPVIWRRKHKRF